LYFGASAGLWVGDGAPLPCAVVAPPAEEEDAFDAVSVPPAAAAGWRFAVPCLVDVAVPLFFACDEPAFFDVLDAVPSEEGRLVADELLLVVLVAEPLVLVAALVVFVVFGAEPLAFVAGLVVAGLVAAGVVAAGAEVAGAEVAALVGVWLVVVVVVVVEVWSEESDDDPECCCETQVWYELIRDHSVQCAVVIRSPSLS
jgi:hypothetical protein